MSWKVEKYFLQRPLKFHEPWKYFFIYSLSLLSLLLVKSENVACVRIKWRFFMFPLFHFEVSLEICSFDHDFSWQTKWWEHFKINVRDKGWKRNCHFSHFPEWTGKARKTHKNIKRCQSRHINSSTKCTKCD